MKEYPMTFDEFIKNFSTEEQCRDYLFKLRWPDGFVCPACGVTKYWLVNNKLYECIECGRQTSVISSTIFQDTRSPLTKWFTAIWWITTQKNGASAKGLQQILGLSSYETAWAWLHKIRKAMVRSDRTKLSGTVEVDETCIGGEEHSGSTGRGTGNKVLVAIAAEVDGEGRLGRVRLRVIPDASKSSLISFVTDNVETGSEVITDGWPSYSSLGKNDYKHTVHVQKGKSGEEKLLPHVHLIISLLKRWLLGTHQGAASDKHMQAYLEEYTFRFNRRKAAQRGLLFYRLLEGAVGISPHTYFDIVKSEANQN
jgi:transposase-like protein/Zn ribbon nucleic-acid-binding protein